MASQEQDTAAAPQMPAFDPTMLMAPALIYFWKKLDLDTSEGSDTLFIMRCAFVAVNIGIALAYALVVQSRIKARNEVKGTVEVDVAPSMESPNGGKETITFMEHDMREASQGMKQSLIGLAIVSFIHYKWGYVQPLFISPAMSVVNFFKNKVVQVHLFGASTDGANKRPWKKPNPFAAFMPPKPTDVAVDDKKEENKKDK